MTATAAEERGFLEAIRDDPADDAPRLVYADWLEEHGQGERAEFVRVQVELAALGTDPRKPCGGYYCDTYDDGTTAHRDCSFVRLTARQDALLAARWGVWLHETFGGLAFDVGVSNRGDGTFGVSLYNAVSEFDRRTGAEIGHFDCAFRRGLVASVSLPVAAWCGGPCEALGPAIAAACPGLVEVRFSNREPYRPRPGARFCWADYTLPECADRSELPGVLTQHLEAEPEGTSGFGTLWRYPTAAAAWADLSRAALRLAGARV